MPAALKWVCPIGYEWSARHLDISFGILAKYCRQIPRDEFVREGEVVIDDPVDPIAVNPGDGSGLPPEVLPKRRPIPGPFFFDSWGQLLGPEPLQAILNPPKDCGCGCKGAGTCSPIAKTKKQAGLALLALLLL